MSSSHHRLLNLPDARNMTQCWQSVRRSVGPAIICQAEKNKRPVGSWSCILYLVPSFMSCEECYRKLLLLHNMVLWQGDKCICKGLFLGHSSFSSSLTKCRGFYQQIMSSAKTYDGIVGDKMGRQMLQKCLFYFLSGKMLFVEYHNFGTYVSIYKSVIK